jgi:hypothetical protein
VLSTEKPSRLFYNVGGTLLFTSYENHNGVNIYITSDEEIKEGDYALQFHYGKISIVKCDSQNKSVINNSSLDLYAIKIILTTDQDLIKDGVQTIDDDFLEWFVKNPTCERVEVEYNEYEMFGNKSKKWIDSHNCYEIIIPQEEPTTCECGANTSCQCEPEKPVKDLEYWKNNAEEDYMTTPISVLRYIGELEKEVELLEKK